tara:strand:- start:601 stop:1731 length:1131 start_codon:yes stop_codon:yes gene_type:complete
MVQTLAARDITENISVYDTTTTGACTLFDGITSGTTHIATNGGRTGEIRIGNGGSSGVVVIDSGSSKLDLQGGAVTIQPANSSILNISVVSARTGAINMGNSSSSGNITIDAGSSTLNLRGANANIADTTTTGTCNLFTGVTSGPIIVASNSTRSGLLKIGDSSASGNIEIDSGSGALSIRGGSANIADSTTTGTCNLFTGVTSGSVNIASGTSRTSAITVGNASSSGTISIDAGSSALNLSGNNYVTGSMSPGMEDSSGNSATITGASTGAYTQMGNVITGWFRMQYSSIASMVAGDKIRITGFPIASLATHDGSVCDGFIFFGQASGNYRLEMIAGQTYANIKVNSSSTNVNVITSAIQTTSSPFLSCQFTYFV